MYFNFILPILTFLSFFFYNLKIYKFLFNVTIFYFLELNHHIEITM